MRENGNNFSTGERQKIALLRVLCRDFKVLIIDEGLNAMDKISEERIVKYILDELNEHIIVYISHRPKYIHKFNKVIYMNNGMIQYEKNL